MLGTARRISLRGTCRTRDYNSDDIFPPRARLYYSPPDSRYEIYRISGNIRRLSFQFIPHFPNGKSGEGWGRRRGEGVGVPS